jgi:hypothetical protein
MKLHFFQTTVSLLFIIHIKDFDQFHRHNLLGGHILGFENIRKLALAYNLEK